MWTTTPSALVLALLVGCEGASPPSSAAQTQTRQARAADQAAPAIDQSRHTAITAAVGRVSPAVVTVQTEQVQAVPADVFEMFFGGRSGQRVTPGIGSGFITRGDGIILTNAHVVAGAARVSVALRDGTTFPASVIGADESNDLAVLRIDAAGLPTAPLGNSDELLVGEWAIAIGNPYGFLLGNTEPSVTTGVVSGTGRNLIGGGQAAGAYLDMIQTDASINPGNSGGPLVNAAGEVIGVNSSIYSPTGGSIGLGFAIPVNRAKRVMEDLLEHGRVRRAWVGLQVAFPEGPTPRLSLNTGVTVRAVTPDSPAARAGIRPADELLQSRSRQLRNVYDWQTELLDLRVGEEVPIRLRRSGREQTVTLVAADLPQVTAPRVEVLRDVQLVTLTPAIRAENDIRAARGALVVEISEAMSQRIGLQAGDVILQINRAVIETAPDVQRALEFYTGRGPIRMWFEHRGRVFTVDF
ncbi:MAG TPA: trypsin-like peptidase domain-containing protein [Gemmatimonadaceae bacterium]|nr:trypsin-like peptidase domain-containing protein [Gemmatimonadaceae bacterium]